MFNEIGIQVPTILIPSEDVNMNRWSVVACDQFTSQREYWEEAAQYVDGSPSTLQLIFPEVYLEDSNPEDRIHQINHTMMDYLDKGILVPQPPGFVYVDRKTSRAESRKGLILAVDLEHYEYTKGAQSLIRATEGTVIDRLPPRVRIREKAPIELPHVMLLIDDPDQTVIEPLSQKADQLQKLYDFDLMMNGGHIRGYKVDDPQMLDSIFHALKRLIHPQVYSSKYGISSKTDYLLFAAGDGNHSLASAKVHWENVKQALSPEEQTHHPARYALVEVVNIHDPGLEFEPIHRVVFNTAPDDLIHSLCSFFESAGSDILWREFNIKAEMDKEAAVLYHQKDTHVICYTAQGRYGLITVMNPPHTLVVGTLQGFLDIYLQQNPTARVDYIHGDDVVTSLSSREGNVGFYLPPLNKQDFFKTIILDGALPRKTFSMGEAEEKRYYLECRRIR